MIDVYLVKSTHTYIYNSKLKTYSTYPDDWKKANITCIFKKRNKQDPGNYRPVSLTSVICKLLERTVREEIVNHLSVNKLLSDSQFGFRKNRSTILQLLTVMNEWTEALDDGIQIDTVYLDFRKAFDSVPHKRLIKKLEGYGIKGILLEWFKNFLNGRQQRVVINGKTSDWTNVLSGIPQGSILGPILKDFENASPRLNPLLHKP